MQVQIKQKSVILPLFPENPGQFLSYQETSKYTVIRLYLNFMSFLQSNNPFCTTCQIRKKKKIGENCIPSKPLRAFQTICSVFTSIISNKSCCEWRNSYFKHPSISNLSTNWKQALALIGLFYSSNDFLNNKLYYSACI